MSTFQSTAHRRRRKQTRHRRSRAEQLERRDLLAASLSIGDATVEEGNPGGAPAELQFPITRGGDTSEELTVTFEIFAAGDDLPTDDERGAAQRGLAAAGGNDADFVVPAFQTITIPAGSASETLTITVNPDVVPEGDERLEVRFKSVVGEVTFASDADTRATGTIVNDDQPNELLELLSSLDTDERDRLIRQVKDGFDDTFAQIVAGIETAIDEISGVPIVGGQLADAVEPVLTEIEAIQTDLTELVETVFTSTSENLIADFQNAMFEILEPILMDSPDAGTDLSASDILLSYGADDLDGPNGEGDGNPDPGTSWVQFDFHLGQRTIQDLPFEFDLGAATALPGLEALGLSVDASDGLRFDLQWNLRYGFGLSQRYGIDPNFDLDYFYVNSGAVDVTGTPVEEFRASIDIKSAPAKDGDGFDVLSTDAGLKAEATIGLLAAKVEDGIPFAVDITAEQGFDFGGSETEAEFTLVIDAGGDEPVEVDITGLALPTGADDDLAGALENLGTFLIDLQAELIAQLEGKFNDVETTQGEGQTALVPVTVSLDFGSINGFANPDLPTTPSIVLSAEIPQISSMTIIGGGELGFAESNLGSLLDPGPLGQFDDGRSAALGFNASPFDESDFTTASSEVVPGRFRLRAGAAAPASGLLRQDTEFTLVLNNGQGAESEERILISIGEEQNRDIKSLRDQLNTKSLESVFRDTINQAISQQQKNNAYETIDVQIDDEGFFVLTSRGDADNPGPTLDIDYPSTDQSKISVVFTVDIDDPNWTLFNQRQNPNDQAFLDRVTRGDIQDAKKITDRFQPEAEASVALKLHTTADLNALIDEAGDSIPSLPLVDGGLLLPQIEFDFVLDATASAKFKNPTNPSDEAGEKRYTNELETLKFENVTIDIGSLLETFVEPVANVLGAALGPVSEIVGGLGGGSFLNENLPILKDIPGNNFKSLLDFLGDANRDDLNAFRQALGSLVEISSAVEGLLEDFEDRAIALGCFEYAKLNEQAESRTLIPCAAASAIDSATSVEATQFINAYNQATNTTGGIRPDFIFPTNFVKLLSGEDADLVSLNLPALDITAEKKINLNVGVAEADIKFKAKVSTNLALVYDSVGLRRVVDAIRKDDEPIWEDLLKGLYIRSQDGKEIEVTISGDGQVGVDVELASGNVVAEADGSVSLDIVDPNEDGALRLDEIESLTGGDLSKVFCLFDAAASFNGKIDVRLEFFGLAGSLSDVPGAKDISEVNVDWNLSDILGSTCSTPEPVLASSRSGGRVIQIHTGPFARDRRAGDVSDEDGPAEIKVVEDDNKIIVTGFGGRTEVPFDSSLNPTIAIAGGPFGDTFDLSDVRTLSIQMDGRGGSDLLLGGRANDVIEGGDGSDEIDPGSGDDLVFTGTGTNLVFSSSGADTIDASENSSSDGFQYIGGGSHANEGDTVIGSAADDTITATNVEGGDGDDTIRGSGTGGTLHGGAGNDTIYGGDGNQTLIGGPGEDSLDGGPGEDSLLGGEDDDQLISGYGDVLVDGGSGTDEMMVDLAVELTGLNVTGIDVTLGAGSYSAKSIGGSFDELTTIYSGVEEIDFSTGNESDSITINGVNVPTSISAGAGEDTFHLISNAAEVELNAGADNDELVINRSGKIDPIDALLRPRRISGFGAADVTLFGNSLEKITMTLGDGDDRVRLVVPSAETRINGGGGDADTVIVDSLQARSRITAEQVFLEIDSTPSGIRDEFGEVGLLLVTADRLWVDNRDNTNALDFSVKNRDVLVAGLDGSLIENISGVGRVEFLGSTAAATQDTLEVIDTAESTKTFRIENDVVEVFQGSDVLVFEAESSGINLEYPVTPQLDGPFHVLFSEGTNPNNPGKHAYVIDGSRISVFDVVRSSSYRLLPSRSTPTPFSINVNTDAVFDPSGRFLFITGNFVDPDDSQSSINKIAIYERDVVTGELTLVETVDAIEPAPKGRIEIADIQVADDYVFLAIEELDDPNGSATRVYRFDRERNSQSELTGKLIKGRVVGAPVSGEPVDSVLDTDDSDDLFVLTQNGINLVVYRYSVDSGDDSVVRGPFESFRKPVEGTDAKIEIQPVRNNQPRKVYIVENDIVTVTQREGGGGDLRRIQGVNLPASEQTSAQLDSTDVEFNDDGSEIYINNDAQIQTYQLAAGGDTDGQFVNPAGDPTGGPVPIATSDLPVWNFIGTDSLARDPRSGRFIAPTANDEITVFSNSLEAIQTIVDGAPPTFEADSLKKLVFTKFRPGRGSAYGIAEGPEGGYLVEFTRSKKTEGEFNPRSILTPDDWEFDLLRDKKLEFAEDLVLADDKHLYVATAGSNGSNGGIQLFQRDRGTGDIDFQTTFEAFAPFDDARTLKLSPDGTKLWAGSYDTIRSWTRDPDTGFLTEPKSATLSQPTELFVDPDSDFLFVALGGTDGGIATRLQSDVSNSVQFESLANATSVKRIGNQLYAGTSDGILKVYNVDKDGQLTLLQTVSGGSGGSGSLADIVDIVSSRRDRFVFAGSVEGTILAYARDRSTGRLAFAQRITQGIGSFNAAEGIEGMTSMTFDLSEQDYFADLLYVASPSGWSAIQVLPSFATSGASYRVGFDGNFGSLEVGSNVSTPGGDFTDIVRSSGTGNIPLTIRTFGGADEISIASQPSSLTLDTGDGNDFVSLRSVSGGETDVDLGNGEDTIEVNLPGIQSPAPVDVDGGPHSSGDQLIYISGSLTVEEPPSELTTPTGQITIGTDKIIDWVEIESLLALDNLTADITSDDPEIAEGDELTLTATASSIGRTIPDSSFLWDLDSDGLYGDAIGGSITLGWDELQNLGIDDDGSYPISVQVQFDGLRSVDVTTLTVNNTVPSPEITVSPTTVEQFSTIRLVLASDDPGNDTIERWEIDWESDGTIDDIYFIRAGTVTHVYQTAGTKDITATAYDEDGGPYAAPTATVQVNAIPPRVRAITGDQSLDEGDTGTYTLTASTLEAGGGTTTAVSWLVNFGDGTIESVSGSTAGPTVTHTYADDGMYTISALVVESDGTIVPATTTLTVSVANVANPMISVPADFQSNTGLDFLGAEGRPFELILTNDDPGDDTTTEWRIDWDGDGPMPPQSYTDAPQNLTTVEFIYTSEFPPPLEIRAVMIDEDGEHPTNVLFGEIANTPPTPLIIGETNNAVEASPFVVTLDPGTEWINTQIVRWRIERSDGAEVEIVQLDQPSTTVTTTLEFPDGDGSAITINAFAIDDEDQEFLATLSVPVLNVPPTIQLSGPPAIEENNLFTLTFGEIVDPAVIDTVEFYTVHWGDGTSTTYTAAEVASANGVVEHLYVDDPPGIPDFRTTLSVDLEDEDGLAPEAGTFSFFIENIDPVADPGGPYQILIPETQIELLGSATDQSPEDTFTFEWDFDNDGEFDDAAGPTPIFDAVAAGASPGQIFYVALRVTDDDGGVSEPVTTTVQYLSIPEITDLVLPTDPILENQPFTLTVLFEDTDPKQTHTVTVLWGDETSSEVLLMGGEREVEIPHTYLDDDPTGTPVDPYDITVTVANSAADDEASTVVDVNNVNPEIASFTSDANSLKTKSVDNLVLVSGDVSDVGSEDTHTAVIDWGDGSNPETIDVDQLTRGFAAQHDYPGPGIYEITATVIDDDGGVSQIATTAAVIQGVGLVDGTLFIIGTDGRDHVTLHYKEKKDELDLNVKFNQGAGQNHVKTTFQASSIQRIVAFLCGGDDHYHGKIDGNKGSSISIRQIVFGGDGRDHLQGGDTEDALLGGSGKDDVKGRGGNDLLIGGHGEDKIYGDHGDDLLIGDAIGADESAVTTVGRLDAALQSWAAAADPGGAVSALSGIIDDGDDDRLHDRKGANEFIEGSNNKPWIWWLDVDGNGESTALDALLIINRLSRTDRAAGEAEGYVPETDLYDINQDGRVTSLDALQIINALTRSATQSAGSAPRYTPPVASWQDEVDTLMSDRDRLGRLYPSLDEPIF